MPTPLGNRGDITLRALEALRSCDLLVAEDTRTAKRLLAMYDLPPRPLWSYREQNAAEVTGTILARARDSVVAVVSDAGTPSISDPGRGLVVAARAAGVTVEVLPGAVAFVVAAVLSGFPLNDLRFSGFMPRPRGERERIVREAVASRATHAWYESPRRIAATLSTFAELFPEAPLFLARELTKFYEQQLSGKAEQIAAALPAPIRGEIVLVLGPSAASTCSDGYEGIEAAIVAAAAGDASPAQAAREIAKAFGLERGDVYRRIVALR